MNKSIIKLIIIFAVLFSYPHSSFAVKMDKLKVCGYDATNLDFIEVHEEDLVEVKKKVWETSSNFSISVEGSIFPASGVSKVQYSLRGGLSGFLRAQGEDPFYFTFAPLDGTTYTVMIRFFNKQEEIIFTREIKIKYSKIDWNIFFKEKIEEVRRAYLEGELDEFIAFFDDEEFPFFPQFKKDVKSTFDDNSRIRLSLTVKSVEVSSDTAVVDIDWHKTFEDDSSQSGEDDSISFQERRDGTWRVASVSDNVMFIIGTGTINFKY